MRGFVDCRAGPPPARFHQVARQFGLAIDHDALAAGQRVHVDAVAPAAAQHLEAAMHQALAMHALADAGLVQQVDGDLLQHAGADAAEHVFARSGAR